MQETLRVDEGLLLLALRDEDGTVRCRAYLNLALAAGLLSELALRERIQVVTPKKTPLVELRDGTPCGLPGLDLALEKLRESKRRASAQTWVSRLSGVRDLRHAIAEGLVQRGILEEDERRVLLLFKQTVYPERDGGPERQLVEQVREAIFGEGRPDARVASVAGIAYATGVLYSVFGRKEVRGREDRIKSLIEDRPGASAALAAVQAANAAVIAATTAATTAMTTTMLINN